jgi:hypothetical protein
MADTVKKFRITGEAAKSLMTETKTRRRQRGGAAPVQVTRSDAAAFTPLPTAPVVKPYVPAAPANVASLPVANAPVKQDGGRRYVKVILEKSNNKTRKLILAPKKVIKLPPGPLQSTGTSVPKKHPAKTQKVARRIRVSVSGLNKRVNRAKTIKKESQVMPIEKLKKELETAGLIKAGSKAPETILRQMYTDFQVLKQRAL